MKRRRLSAFGAEVNLDAPERHVLSRLLVVVKPGSVQPRVCVDFPEVSTIIR